MQIDASIIYENAMARLFKTERELIETKAILEQTLIENEKLQNENDELKHNK